jgi:glycosyltransferase involved in cell wall biosynthesis
MHRFPDMMRQLSRYDWGLCGHLDSHPQWQKAMPNKLFEYIAAGIPIISINAGEVSEFVNEHGIGYSADGADYLNRIATDSVLRNAYADVIMEKRHKFTMESQVPEIEALYAEAAAYRKGRLEAGLSVRDRQEGREADGKWVCFGNKVAAPKDNGGGDKLRSAV